MMNIYSLLKLFVKIKSPRLRLLGLYLLHISRRRYIGVFLDPVMACNLRCRMCYFSGGEFKNNKIGRLLPEDYELMARGLFHRVLKLQIGCGAEPTLYKGLPEVIGIGKKYGIPYISLTTNGKLLDEDSLFRLAESGLNELTLSAHGLRRDTYESMMLQADYGDFLRVLSAVGKLKKHFPHFKLRINYTVNEDNLEDLKDFRKVFGEVPVDVIQIRPVQEIGDSLYRNFSLKKIEEHYEEVFPPLVDYCKERGIVCLYPTKENLTVLEESPASDIALLMQKISYCYIYPGFCWREDYDFHTETFESYSRRTGLSGYILRSLLGRKQTLEREKTHSLNYTVK